MSTKHTAPRPTKRDGPVDHLIAPGLGIFTVAEADVYTADTRSCASPPIGIDNS
ncbi:MAG: hypothetical protein KBA91_03670 [Candidatus Moranbacteria bacterium]|nr:hypothetical protein [Candidatus Moranbacteria bacterium]